MNNNLLFIDDENEILTICKSLFIKKSQTQNLEKLAQSFLDEEISTDLEINNKMPHPLDNIEFNVFTAAQGQDGISIIKEQLAKKDPINVAFIDMRMPPGINGGKTAKIIREIDPNVEIVILTAHTEVDLDLIVNDVGAPDKLLYLKKPFDQEEIKQLALNLTVKYFNNNIKNNFITNISHELKTPITVISGFAELLGELTSMPDEGKDYIKILGQSAKLMRQLVDDLISTVEIEKKGIQIKKNKCSINELLKNIFQMTTPLNTKKDQIHFDCKYLDGNDCYEIDSLKIQQSLLNFLSNAFKFTTQGHITLKAIQKKNQLILAVKDTGIGIPQDKFKKIFEKFTRIEDEHHNRPGLGLGLSIAKEIINAHGGQLKVDSQLDHGSEFSILLPIKPVSKG